MPEQPLANARVDRLSSLPPELLTVIFDLAHDPEHPLTDPLSRNLLPYFRRNLYRHVRLVHEGSRLAFSETIRAHPALGSLVHQLDIHDSWPWGGLDAEMLAGVFGHLGRLETLAIPSPPISDLALSSIPRLVSLACRCAVLRFSRLENLVHLVHLRRLDIEFDSFDGAGRARLGSLQLQQVKELSLRSFSREEAVWDRRLARLIDRFPRITSLVLCERGLPDFGDLLAHLSTSTTSLTSLSLSAQSQDEFVEYRCEQHLPRFQNLERVVLCEGTVSPALPASLRQLPKLSYLHLGPETHYNLPRIEPLLSLIQGPDKVPTLKTLVFDAIGGQIGKRIDVRETKVQKMDKDGWELPDFAQWYEHDVQRLQNAGRRSGVKVEGTSFHAPTISASYDLEQANRCILKAYRSKSLTGYYKLRKSRLHHRLPDIDVDELDLDHLKLVKIDLPEEGWFQLTLE
ncbi:hypothetical protein JCM3766R1_005897 [Sporobolomyces carnicolor]